MANYRSKSGFNGNRRNKGTKKLQWVMKNKKDKEQQTYYIKRQTISGNREEI